MPERGVLPRFQLRLPRLKPGHKGFDGLGGAEVVMQRLAGQDGDGKRVPGRVPQQWPPVRGDQVVAMAGSERTGQLQTLPHRHSWEVDAGGKTSEPVALVAAGGEQHLALGLLCQIAEQVGKVVLFGGGPVARGANREPGDRLDVVPYPKHGHLL